MNDSLSRNFPYAENAANILRGLLNGVKHTAESFAPIHDLDPDYLEAVMQGKEPITEEIVQAIEHHSPLNARDLFRPDWREEIPIQDDTTGGVVVCSASQTKGTKRRFYRGPKGKEAPFYDYADTAMSKTSAFRPEWIAELFTDQGDDPDSAPDWAFNKGHFEFQLTYFIGPVNFHWIDKKGKKHVCQMDTGDVNFITPFVPHTFTTRTSGSGLILAVTYGGAISTPRFQAEIQRLLLKKFTGKYLTEVEKRSGAIDQTISQSACAQISDLGGVMVKKNQGADVKHIQGLAIREMINGIPFQPFTKAYEYDIHAQVAKGPFQSEGETWGYIIKGLPLELNWMGCYSKRIDQGGSFFVRPEVPYILRNSTETHTQVVIMEIKPGAGDPLDELGMIAKFAGIEGLKRVHSETMQWF